MKVQHIVIMSHSVCETLWCSLNSRPIQDTCKRCSHLRTYLLCADCGIIKRDQGVTSRNRRAWAMGTLPNTTTREKGPLAVLCSHCSCCQASSPFAEQELTSRSRPECFARFVFSSCRRLIFLFWVTVGLLRGCCAPPLGHNLWRLDLPRHPTPDRASCIDLLCRRILPDSPSRNLSSARSSLCCALNRLCVAE